MERIKQIIFELEPLLVEQLEVDTQCLVEAIEQKKDFIISELSAVVSAVLEQAVLLQAANLKGPITYISFSLLLSNILADQHGFQAGAFDDRFFVDTQEAVASWNPSYLFSSMQKCFDYAAAIAKQRIPRLQPYELVDAKHAFFLNYYAIATQVLIHSLPHVFEPLSIPTLKRAEKVLVVTGLYMEKQDCIYVWG